MAEHLDVKSGTRWRSEATRLLTVEILPEIGSDRLANISRTDLTSLVDRKAAQLRKKGQSGVTANRMVAVLARFFGYAADKGWLPVSPAIRLPKPVVEVKRDRVLKPVELGEAWIALQSALAGDDSMPLAYARVLGLLMLTGARASEITGLRRSAVDLDAGSITIVAGKTAASRRVLPVGPSARALLAATVESVGNAPDALLFPMPRARGLIPSLDISKAARSLVERLRHTRWTPHDLRRTLVTQLYELGVDGDVTRRIAGLVGADVHSTVYDRSRQIEKMRSALAEYESFIFSCAAKLEKLSENNAIALRA
jgi:integrase